MKQVNATTDNNNKDDDRKTKLYKIGKLSSVFTKKKNLYAEISLVIGIIILLGHAMRIEGEFS